MNFYACVLSQIAHFQMGENGKFMVKALVFSFACSLVENIAFELGRERKILPFFSEDHKIYGIISRHRHKMKIFPLLLAR
jgi:hypothetical protein